MSHYTTLVTPSCPVKFGYRVSLPNDIDGRTTEWSAFNYVLNDEDCMEIRRENTFHSGPGKIYGRVSIWRTGRRTLVKLTMGYDI